MERRPELASLRMTGFSRIRTRCQKVFWEFDRAPRCKKRPATGIRFFLDDRRSPIGPMGLPSSVQKVPRTLAERLARDASVVAVPSCEMSLDEEDDDLPWMLDRRRQRKELLSQVRCLRHWNWSSGIKFMCQGTNSHRDCTIVFCGWRRFKTLNLSRPSYAAPNFRETARHPLRRRGGKVLQYPEAA